MWRSTVMAVLLGVLLAGCSLGGGSAAPGSQSHWGFLEGRVFTWKCGPHFRGVCPVVPYRGEIVFCPDQNTNGLCPGTRVDARGEYRIRLHAGRVYLLPAPGKGNVVEVTPRWVSVVAGETRTVIINGGNLQKQPSA